MPEPTQYRNLFDEFAPIPGETQDPVAQPEESLGVGGFLLDVAKAPFRGINDAATGVANLFGAQSEDLLGWGHSKSTVGGLVEGVSQFMTGFIPAAGALGRFGGLLSKGAQAASTGAKAAAIGLGRGIAAGAVADFAVFDGNDPRLSNLIQEFPTLQNGVTKFLAASPDDSEAFGRLKNVIEGAALGGATEGILSMFKGIKKYNKAVLEGDHKAAAKEAEKIQSIAEDTLAAPTDPVDAASRDLVDPATIGERKPELEGYDPILDTQDPTKPPAPLAIPEPTNEPKAPEAPQEPKPAPDPNKVPEDVGEELSTNDIVNRVGWDPEGGITIVADANKVGDTIKGLSQIDGYVREPNSRLQVLQLHPDADILLANSSEAKRLLGPAKGLRGLSKDDIEKRLIEAARQEGKDGISFRRKSGTETVVLNDKAIARRINVKSNESFYDVRAQSLAIQDPRLVEKSPIQAAIYHMEIGPETATKVMDLWDEAVKNPKPGEDYMGKMAGVISLSKMGERGKRAFYEVFATQFDHEKLRDASVPWEKTIENAAYELSKMAGVDTHHVAKILDIQANAVNRAGGIAVAAKKYSDILLNETTALMTDLLNGKTITDRSGNALSREASAELLNQNLLYYQGFMRSHLRLGSSIGRALNSMKISVDRMSKNAVMRSLETQGSSVEQVLKTAKDFLEEAQRGNAHLGGQIMRSYDKKNGFMAKLMDWYMFSLLSAPKTLTTNIIGSTATMMFRPMETALGAWVGKKIMGKEAYEGFNRTISKNLRAVSISRDMMMEAAGLKGTLSSDTATALDATRKAYSSSQGVLVAERAWQDGVGKAADPTSEMGAMVRMMLNGTKLPSKFMAASDEFVKQVAYHSHIRAELIERAHANKLSGPAMQDWVDTQMLGMTLSGQAKNADTLRDAAERIYQPTRFADEANRQLHIQDYIDKHLADKDSHGMFVAGRSALMDDAIRIAREVTFTTGLTPERGVLSKAGHLLQQLADAHPSVRFFTPFIRTPMNILMFTADRLPVPGLNKDIIPMVQYLASKVGLPGGVAASNSKFIREVMSSNPQIAAEALGRASTAMGSLAVLGTAAMSGAITGAGPADPEQASILRATGWQPYSLKVGDAYISYQRFDPFASIMSFYADWGDTVRYSGHDAPGVEDVGIAAFTALVENLNSKSYLAGLTDLFKLLSDPEAQAPKTIGRIAGSLAVPNVLAASRSFTDDSLGELRTVLDRVKARIPFLTDNGNLQRNAIGEPVTKKTFDGALKMGEGIAGYMLPIQFNITGNDQVDKELADLAFPFTPPAPQKYGIDLRDYANSKGQSAYDRWQQLTSQTTIGGRTLRSALERMINSHKYQSLEKQTVESLDLESPRIQMINGLLGKYRRQAEREMMSEYPDLQDFTKQQRQARRALQAGQQSTDIQSLLSGGR